MKEYVKKLKCLGDETRLRIINLLLSSKKALCVCELVDALEIPVYTISKHIKELKNASIVEETKEGKFVMYSLVSDENIFFSSLLALVQSIEHQVFIEDLKKMKERVSLRVDGKCVVGLKAH